MGRTQTKIETAVLAVVGTYVALLGLTIGGAVLAALKGDVHVAAWVVALLIGSALVVGLLFGLILVRGLYRPRLGEFEASLAQSSAEAEKARTEALLERERREAMEPDVEAMQRFGIYADYIYRVLDDIAANPEEFANVKGDAVKATICALPRDIIKQAVGASVRLSLWFEGNPDQARENIPFVGSKQPFKQFWIPCAPDHSEREIKAFQVAVRNSWLLRSRQAQESDPNGRERIFNVDDLKIAGVDGDDINVFVEKEYQAVFGTTFRFGDRQGYLVVLSEAVRPLSKAEHRFVELLAACLNVISDLATAYELPTT
jgi:hypothetical protein